MKDNNKKVKFDISEFVNIDTEQTIMSNIVRSFIERRKEYKISQEKLAQKSGVSYGSIKRFEQTGDISLSSLIKLANSINCLSDFKNLFQTPIIKSIKEDD